MMQVTVLYRNGWTIYPVTVEISDNCPVCGGERGRPYWHRFHDTGEWLDVHRWENPCGHVDKYPAVLIEGGHKLSVWAAIKKTRGK